MTKPRKLLKILAGVCAAFLAIIIGALVWVELSIYPAGALSLRSYQAKNVSETSTFIKFDAKGMKKRQWLL